VKRAILAFALAAGVMTARADDTRLTGSPDPAYVGGRVTFTATFSVPCADGVSSALFIVDGVPHLVPARLTDGVHAVAELSTSFRSAGRHGIVFKWATAMPASGASCGGSAALTETVLARTPPSPSAPPRPTVKPTSAPSSATPAAAPSPPPSPSPPAQPSATASGTRLTSETEADPAPPLYAVAAGVAVVVLAAMSGAAIRHRDSV